MAITIDWLTKVINVPRADMALVQTVPFEIRELDIDTFRLALKDIEDGEDGQPQLDTHSHNTTVTVGGVSLARVVEIINGYTVTFENGTYAVNLVGANSNIADVTNLNEVQIRSANSAGLTDLGAINANIDVALKFLRNKTVTDPVTGIMTVYDDDGTTPYLTAQLYEDATETQTYRGTGAEVRERLE